jgi:hypothetical protein
MSLSIAMSFNNLMDVAEKEQDEIIRLGKELDIERTQLEEQLNELQNKAQELMARKLRLSETVNQLRDQINSVLPSKEDNKLSEIDYFIADDGYCYVDTFKREWIDEHVDKQSGPLHCSNCEAFGTINQEGRVIFLGYCLNCSEYLYNNNRGSGFEGFETLRDRDTIDKNAPEHLKKYRDEILSYIDKRMSDLETLAQFPSNELPQTSTQSELHIPTVSAVRHFSGDCDGFCDNSYGPNYQEQEDSSDDYNGYVCECCHPK